MKRWNTENFREIDVRGIQGNFYPGIKQQAMKLKVGEGLEIIQNFDPLPLYEVMTDLGYEYCTEKTDDTEHADRFL